MTQERKKRFHKLGTLYLMFFFIVVTKQLERSYQSWELDESTDLYRRKKEKQAVSENKYFIIPTIFIHCCSFLVCLAVVTKLSYCFILFFRLR